MAGARRTWILCAGTVLLVLGLGAAFINLVESRRAEAAHQAALETAFGYGKRIETELDKALAIATVLVAALQQTSDVESLDPLATALLHAHTALFRLSLAPNNVVARSYPRDSDDSVGENFLKDPAMSVFVMEVMKANRPGLWGPIALGRRGSALLGLIPVVLPRPGGADHFWGFILISVGVRELLSLSQLDGLKEQGYHYQLTTNRTTGRRAALLARSIEVDLVAPVRVAVRAANVTWTLAVEPRSGWRSDSLLATEVVFVCLAAVIAAVSTNRFLKEPDILRHEIEVRHRRLSEARARLQAEVTQRREAEERLLHEAAHDLLTGLANRVSFTSQVQAALDFLRDHSGVSSVAVLFLDLDRFKQVNDALGPAVGDRLLVEVGRRLEACLGSSDTLARIGGNEFAILVCDAQHEPAVGALAERLLNELKRPFGLGSDEIFVTASIGVVLASAQHRQAEELLRDADTATHRAKARGRARYELFDDKMRARVVSNLHVESDLRRAIEREEFLVYYQPLISLETGQIAGCEALVRWQHPARGLVAPGEFVPLAEETGLIIWIDRWVLREASRQVRAWQERFPEQPLKLSANLSRRQLTQPHVVQHIADILQDSGFDPANLKLEITESVVMENAESALEILSALRDMGIVLLIDDFGTGYSSLSCLERFPFGGVKIDRSFVKEMHVRERDVEIVRTIVELARKLDMDTIAEGVEMPEQLARLRDVGCGHAQGYLFAKPLEAAALGQLLSARPRW